MVSAVMMSGQAAFTCAVVTRPTGATGVAEAAVVGANDATTGQAIIAYVTLRGGMDVGEQVLRDHVAKEIGAKHATKLADVTAAADVIFTVVTDDNAQLGVFAESGDSLLVNSKGKIFVNWRSFMALPLLKQVNKIRVGRGWY